MVTTSKGNIDNAQYEGEYSYVVHYFKRCSLVKSIALKSCSLPAGFLNTQLRTYVQPAACVALTALIHAWYFCAGVLSSFMTTLVFVLVPAHRRLVNQLQDALYNFVIGSVH